MLLNLITRALNHDRIQMLYWVSAWVNLIFQPNIAFVILFSKFVSTFVLCKILDLTSIGVGKFSAFKITVWTEQAENLWMWGSCETAVGLH